MSKHERIPLGNWTMTGDDVFEVIARLRTEGRPFCLATVVRTADLTSAKAGAKAVVTADGKIMGHLGGGCVRGAVQRCACEVLASGNAKMISVRPKADDPDAAQEIEVHTSGCPSGGTVDVFIEPYLLPLQLCVLGDTPVAQAVRMHGGLMGFALAAGEADEIAQSDAVIIASQGSKDLDALRAALSGQAAFVAMIASHRKAAALKARLTDEGMDRASVDRLISPAGLDLGGIDPHEIAISVLAQLVAWRRARSGRN